MIKRPLLWILGAYLLGLYLAWQRCNTAYLILIVLILTFLFFLLIYVFPLKLFRKSDRFLLSIPLFILLGFFAMGGQLEPPGLDYCFDKKITCQIIGEVSMVIDKPKSRAVYLKNNRVTLEGRGTYFSENIIVYTTDTEEYRIGNTLMVHGSLQKFSPATNPGQFDEKLYYQIENIDYKMIAKDINMVNADYSLFHQFLYDMKRKLSTVYQEILGDREAGAVIAMLLGEKSLLDEELKELYQDNGISHVLAISGLHVSLFGMAVNRLQKLLRVPKAPAAVLSILVIYCYGIMTNFSVSTNRAVVMMTIYLLSGLLGKTYDMLSGIALSAFIILLQNPMQLLSAGFQLSYGAVLGIAILSPVFSKLYPQANSFLKGLFVSISAHVGTLPFVLYYFYQFPLYGIIVNLIILPFVTVLMIASIMAGIIGLIWLPLGIFVVGSAYYILRFYQWVCSLSSRLPANLITTGRPTQLQLIIYLLLVSVFVWLGCKYKKRWSLLILLAASFLLLLPNQKSNLSITFLDVGQGDGIYIQSDSGTTYLIDGGSSDVKHLGKYILEPFLKINGKQRLDYAIVTHPDEDHINGLQELMEAGNINIGCLLLPDVSPKEEALVILEELAEEKNIPVQYLSRGDVFRDGKLQFLCLHPYPGFRATNSNSYSMVLGVSYGSFDLLLTGDLEKAGEEGLIKYLDSVRTGVGERDMIRVQGRSKFVSQLLYPTVDYDILKVAHHGSKYSTREDFLKLVKPEISIISCGKDNRYGHPHKELLDRLELARSQVEITYETGAITIRTDGEKMKVEQYLKVRTE